jgi:DNA-damage-inducible protein J
MSSKKSATFNMRMEPQKKKQMEEFFQELGLTLAYGVNIFFEKCIMEAGLPFEVKLNEEKKPIVPTARERTQKTVQFAMRLDPYKKAQIEYTFQELGMTIPEAVNIYFEKCLSEWGIPFRVHPWERDLRRRHGSPKESAEELSDQAAGYQDSL